MQRCVLVKNDSCLLIPFCKSTNSLEENRGNRETVIPEGCAGPVQ